MSSEWVSLTLDDVCLKITDGAHQSPKSVEKGRPMCSVKDLTEFGLNIETARHISVEDFDTLVRQGCMPIVGDVLIAKDGNSALDTVCSIDEPVNAVLLSSVAILRPDPCKIDTDFLKYYFKSSKTIDYLKNNFISGAAIPRVVLRDFKKAEILLPDLNKQKAISKILRSIDDKINLNSKVNQTLEQMAQTIFKSWFVDFEPVKAKIAALEAGGSEDDALLAAMQAIAGSALFATDAADADAQTQLARLQAEHPEQYATLRATAELFPSAMQESELGEIPEGWSVCQVENILERLKPVKRYTKKEVSSTGLVPVFEQGADILLGFHNEKAGFTADAKNPAFVFGDHTCITHLSCQDFDISQNVIPLRGRNRSTIWVYYAIQGKQAFQEYRRHWSELIVKPVIYPTRDICERYSETVLRMICFKESLERENRSLAELRDTLLPKLLSGEIDVSALADNTEVNA